MLQVYATHWLLQFGNFALDKKLTMQGYPHEAQTQGYYQSLQPQQHTVTVVNQPQSKPAIQGQPQNIRQWSTGMFDCCSDCRECKIHSTLDHLCRRYLKAVGPTFPIRITL